MKTSLEYISAGINQAKDCLDWNYDNNLICYGAKSHILLYCTKSCSIIGINKDYNGGSFCTIKWVKGCIDQQYIIATCKSGFVSIWKLLPKISSTIENNLQLVATIKADKCAVNFGDAIFDLVRNQIFVVTSTLQSEIKGWLVDLDGNHEDYFLHKLPNRALATGILLVSSGHWSKCTNNPLVLCCATDSKCYILASADGKNYSEIGSLRGHEDCLMTIDFVFDNDDLLLATGSKDGAINVWRLSLDFNTDTSNVLCLKPIEIKLPFGVESQNVSCYCVLESVLHGHTGLVSQVQWMRVNDQINLLSCARTEDRSIIVWGMSANEGIWVENVRLGEVGGNREGFLVAKFGPDAMSIFAASYHGGFHYWTINDGIWEQRSAVSGHIQEVEDIDWDINNRYLLSVSKDQTTRCHSIIKETKGKNTWQEISRPQVHGYDMSCVVHLDAYRFASGAEEKVVRGFMATSSFVTNLCKAKEIKYEPNIDMPARASVPSLGLSNKGVDKKEQNSNYLYSSGDIEDKYPPTEDQLILGTLWPEVSKLYGHGNEILSLAVSSDRETLASSCRAANETDAQIILWNTNTWSEISRLEYHKLSVVQISFSPDDQYILSVSRDRCWAVFRKDEKNNYSLYDDSRKLATKDKHSRIIWTCDWLPSSKAFLTGSRDKHVGIWSLGTNGFVRTANNLEDDEVTAVSVCKKEIESKILIAIGTENGSISLRLFDPIDNTFDTKLMLYPCHKKTVKRLKFNQIGESIYLASCSADSSIFIYNVNMSV